MAQSSDFLPVPIELVTMRVNTTLSHSIMLTTVRDDDGVMVLGVDAGLKLIIAAARAYVKFIIIKGIIWCGAYSNGYLKTSEFGSLFEQQQNR